MSNTAEDVAKLGLRVMFGGLMLFHGVDKLGGVGWLGGMLGKNGLPEALAYGVYVGEIVAPLLLIAGIAMRTSAAAMAFTMVMAVYLVHPDDLLALGKHGEYALEIQLMYGLGPILAAMLGPGRFAVPVKGWMAKL